MRRRKKRGIDVSAIGKVILVCLVLVVAILGYSKYHDSLDSKLNNKVDKKREVDKDTNTTTKETSTVTTTSSTNNSTTNTSSEGKKEYNYKTQDGEDVTIKADKSVTATGFAGAGNYKFFLRGTTLYFRNTSSDDNQEEVLAYNVKDLYLENKEVVAELGKDGKIVKENNYITYK